MVYAYNLVENTSTLSFEAQENKVKTKERKEKHY